MTLLKTIKNKPLISLGILLLAIMVAIVVLDLLADTERYQSTPIIVPQVEDTVIIASNRKMDQYDLELRNGDDDTDRENTEWNRVRMGWGKVYAQDVDTTVMDSEDDWETEESIIELTEKRVTPTPKRKKSAFIPKAKNPRNEITKNPTAHQKPAKTPPRFNLQVKKEAQVVQTKLIPAVLIGTQKIRSGSMVRIQLKESMTHKGIRIPTHTVVSGTAQIRSNRLVITIPQVIVHDMILPLSFTVFDQDKTEGLALDEQSISTNRIEGKVQQGLRRAIPPIPYVRDVASGAVDAARDLNQKRKSKITLPGNYRIFLKPKSS